MTENFDEAATNAEQDSDRLDKEMRQLALALSCLTIFAALICASLSAACYFFTFTNGV